MPLTLRLRDKIVRASEASAGSAQQPLTLPFGQNEADLFQQLNKVGEFSVEFMYIATMLKLIQERSHCSRTPLHRALKDFGAKDRYTVIEHAVAKLRKLPLRTQGQPNTSVD